QGWEFGIPVAALATLAGHRLGLQSGPVQPQVLPAFFWFFLRELFSGGMDVARRALHVNLPIAPAWQTFTLTSRDPRVCLMLSALIGLLPGTLASHYYERELFVHTLDEHRDWKTAVSQLERLLSRLLGGPQP
ncbi:MAG TPA: Na+/H+ antiporter subunit E, partial [Kineobactrum sp.]